MSHKIVVIGDIILDQYHFGKVKRLNPESPNPLLNIERSEYRLGGASNTAANVVGLGASCLLIGNVGNDEAAKTINDLCTVHEIDFMPITTPERTILKTRCLETTYNQQLLRLDFEEKVTVDDFQKAEILEKIENIDPDIIMFADYTKGMASPELIQEICERFGHKKILVDTKPSKFAYYTNTYAFKPNFKEFKEIVGKEIENTDEDIHRYGGDLASQYHTNFVITRGDKGASLVTPQKDIFHLHTQAQTVFDVSGAGDTFFAAIAVALLEGKSLQHAVEFGNKASGIAVSKVGTSIVYRNEIVE